jgi:nicotinate-nucleotide adenylyltransferase
MRIGILGGSFDPIHKGHLTLARESEKQFKLDKILFVPASLPPNKRNDSPLTPVPHRARMVELAIGGEPRWELCDLELRRPGVSFTVDTLAELKKTYPPPHRLFFIVGADSFLDLGNWKDPEEILKLSEWLVAPRPACKLPEKLPHRFYLLKIFPLSISASAIREKAGAGEDLSEWVPAKVGDYIKRMRIYRRKTP